MREILFRGKRMENWSWVEGYLYEHEPAFVGIVSENDVPVQSRWFILRTGFADWNLPRPVEFIEVNPHTVGQYTGLKDKTGKRIFEGDILRWTGEDGEIGRVIVIFAGGSFLLKCVEVLDAPADPFDEFDRGGQTLEVIGNIQDNPELWKGGDEG